MGPKAPACLAEPSSFAKSKAGLGCDAKDQNLCSPDGVPQTGPRSIWCDEMWSVLRLVGIGDTSKLGMVAHAFGRSFNHEIETVEGALPRRKDAVTVSREVLRFPLVWSSAEVQSPFEPDSQQRRDMRAAVRSNRRKPIHLRTRQLISSLRPLRRCRIRAAEGAQLGHRNWFSHAALRSFTFVRANTAMLSGSLSPSSHTDNKYRYGIGLARSQLCPSRAVPAALRQPEGWPMA